MHHERLKLLKQGFNLAVVTRYLVKHTGNEESKLSVNNALWLEHEQQ